MTVHAHVCDSLTLNNIFENSVKLGKKMGGKNSYSSSICFSFFFCYDIKELI